MRAPRRAKQSARHARPTMCPRSPPALPGRCGFARPDKPGIFLAIDDRLSAEKSRRVGAYQDHQFQIFPMRRLERNLVEHQAPARRMIEFPRTAFPFADVLRGPKRANASLAALSESISARVGASFRWRIESARNSATSRRARVSQSTIKLCAPGAVNVKLSRLRS